MSRPILVCSRIKDTPNPITGSDPERCSACQESVWISPSGRQLCRSYDLLVLCTICVQSAPWPMPTGPLTAQQSEEIAMKLFLTGLARWALGIAARSRN